MSITIIDRPQLDMIKGVHANGIAAGIKKNGKLDLGLVSFEKPVSACGMFTTNRIKAAPVIVAKKHIKNKVQALIVNSGNANACTGEMGIVDAINTCKEVGDALGILPTSVIPMSTGVIGQRLPVTTIKNGIVQLVPIVTKANDNNFAQAIMTTDTTMKVYGVQVKTERYEYKIIGCAKGSGMINPTMATMLSFIFSDAKIKRANAEKAFRHAVHQSFNSITVDGDMSTNDSVFLFNTNLSDERRRIHKNEDIMLYQQALEMVTKELAKLIVRDGEGATKLVEIEVKGASNKVHAKKIAFSIANSSLVKTAFYGEDANWGRIVCAIGYSGVRVIPKKIKLYFNNLLLFKNGEPVNFNEQEANLILKKKEFKVTIDLGMGNKSSTVWTTDLSNEYVKINANYRT